MTGARERMLHGLPYDASDPELALARRRAQALLRTFNEAAPDDDRTRADALGALLGRFGERVRIEPPLHCDYGSQIELGDDVYVNAHCTILDCASVTVGHRVLIGPNVMLLAATHPLAAAERRGGLEFALPVAVGDDVWLGAGVIVGPGVTIGARSVVGAGSVVMRDVPPDVLAVGNPCRVLRALA